MKISKNFFIDLLFPRQCLGCNQDNTWVCQKCLSKIELNLGKPKSSSSKYKNLAKVLIVTDYQDKLVANILQSFKYNFIDDLGRNLGSLMVEFLEAKINQGEIENFDLVLAVPLSKKRELWRGFNQAEILAKVVTKNFNWSMEKNVICRKYHTRPQVGLKAHERSKNVKGIFTIKNNQALINKKVLLIDDVITTGATIGECANVLKSAGAKEVWGLVIAEG